MTDSMTLDELTFEVRVSRRRKTIGIIVHRTGRLSLALPYRCPLTAVEAAARKKLPWVRRKLAWYTARGRDWVEKRMAIFAPLVGAEPAVLSVRDLGRRWGSCSAKGKVSFHWQIMLFPPLIADYVIVHELAHLRELNHGKEYWRLVEAIIPDYRERRAWLAGNGHRHVV